ncbi:MAG: ABC transporter permease [Anaerolineae bacterium]|nr:ABC transporter permease [Anaerolineae bacterium]
MNYLASALRAELLKLKRTLAVWLTLLVPAAVVMLFFINYARPGGGSLIPTYANAWLWMAQNALIMWSLIMLPLFVALQTALLSNLDHNAQAWKHLFALPVPRWSIYAAKLIVGVALIGVSMAALVAWIFIAGIGINALNPGIGFEQPFPFGKVLILIAGTYFASWFIIAIQTWIAMRWHSFVVAVGVGIVAVFVSLIVSQSSLWWLFPWSLPGNVENILYRWLAGEALVSPLNLAWRAIGLSIIGGIAAGILGGRQVVQRDVL